MNICSKVASIKMKRDIETINSRCFIKYPYGLATFYGPVVLGVAANWIIFLFIARVIISASRTKAQQTGESNVKMRTVSFTSWIF